MTWLIAWMTACSTATDASDTGAWAEEKAVAEDLLCLAERDEEPVPWGLVTPTTPPSPDGYQTLRCDECAPEMGLAAVKSCQLFAASWGMSVCDCLAAALDAECTGPQACWNEGGYCEVLTVAAGPPPYGICP